MTPPDMKRIMPECYIDTLVVDTIMGMGGKNRANHCHSCTNVCKKMKDKFVDAVAIGVIDNDKVQDRYVQDFVTVFSIEDMEVLRHSQRPHFIIRVSPAMDGFILKLAAREGINPQDYNLPGSLKDFRKYSKDETVEHNVDMHNFIKSLKSNRSLKIMRRVIIELSAHPFNPDLSSLATL